MQHKVNKKKHEPPKYLTAEQQRIERKAQNKSFIGKNFKLKQALMCFLYPLAALISIITGGFHLYINFLSNFKNETTAFSVAAIVVILIEGGKFFFGSASMEAHNDKDFEGTPEEVNAYRCKLFGAFLFFAFSAYISINGGPKVGAYLMEQRNPPTLLDVVAIELEHDNEIARLKIEYDSDIEKEERDKDTGEKSKYRGSTTAEGLEIIKSSKTEIKRLRQEKESQVKNAQNKKEQALADAKTENDERLAKFQAKQSENGKYFFGFSGLGEVLAIICFLFLGNYEKGAEMELKDMNLIDDTPMVQNPTSVPAPSSPPALDMTILSAMVENAVNRALPPPTQASSQNFQNFNPPRKPMGFFSKQKDENNVEPSNDNQKTVQQPSTVVEQQNITVADIKYWKSCVTTYYERSQTEWKPKSSPETLRNNFKTHEEYIERLKAIPNMEFEFELCERKGKPSIRVIEKKKEGNYA